MPRREPFAPAGSVRSLGYRALWTAAEALLRSANACLYLAAGLLRQDDLQAASRFRWRMFSATDDGDSGLEEWERRLYSEVLHPADRVLLVGCGTGRDLVPLLELGYDVTGLDLSRDAVDLARARLKRRGVTARLLTDFVELADFDASYDAVIFSARCYACINGSASRVATLARLRNRLAGDGRVVITYAEPARQSRASLWLMGLGARLARADWRPEPGDSFSLDHLAPHVLRYEHFFRPEEAARECLEAGFRVVRDEMASATGRCLLAVPMKPPASPTL